MSRKYVVLGVVGFLGTIAAIYYFAWVASLSQPVSWNSVATLALFLAPFGAAGLPIAAELS